jgi:hypothetical protein
MWDIGTHTKTDIALRVRSRRSGYTCFLRDASSDSDSISPRWYRQHPPTLSQHSEYNSPDISSSGTSSDGDLSWGSEGIEDSETGQLTPNNDFWTMHLMTRIMGKIRTKPPTRDHILLKKVATYIWQWKLNNSTPRSTSTEAEFADEVHIV